MMNQSNPTIVVAVDYSERGTLAFRRALALARGGTLHVVHVVDPVGWGAVAPLSGQIPPPPVLPEESAAILTIHVEEQAALAGAGANGPSPRIVSHLVVGVPAVEIVQLASDLEADLIVVGTHGRRGVARVLLGSTAERVVRLATCPVLVDRPKASHAAPEPRIEPPCPRCVEARKTSAGAELWCAQHRERHGRRHTYHSTDRNPAFPSAHGGLSSIS